MSNMTLRAVYKDKYESLELVITSIVDPDPYWIHICKTRIKYRQKVQDLIYKLTFQ